MRHLVVAFAGEGPTDERFMAPIIRRLLTEILAGEASAILHQLPIKPPDRKVTTLQRVLSERRPEFDLLILHTDGTGNPAAARRERVDPVRHALATPDGPPVAAAIPVHETEAWALVDGDALRKAFGATGDDRAIGLPPLPQIEGLPDPKEWLQNIYQSVRGRRRPRSPIPYDSIAELISLDRLRALQAFQAFEAEVGDALRALGLEIDARGR